MHLMFYNCISLREIDLSNFEIKNTTLTFDMFAGCTALKELNCADLLIRKEYDAIKKKNNK